MTNQCIVCGVAGQTVRLRPGKRIRYQGEDIGTGPARYVHPSCADAQSAVWKANWGWPR